MSRPACPDWRGFVLHLENQANVGKPGSDEKDLIQRALFALQALRQEGRDVRDAISDAIYSKNDAIIPAQAKVLASIFWPLLCTTNYDDIYLRAKLAQRLPELAQGLPELVGRSEADCRLVLRHIAFPDGELIWVLQGLLRPRDQNVKRELEKKEYFIQEQFEAELVVGHAEYRRAANRAPHFRRCFAELFRTRSLLFLGSGLAEPYFLTLFDEIIELTGPPAHPHFALIKEGDLDPEFMRQQYHIICNTYPAGKHERVTELLCDFKEYMERERARPNAWGFRIAPLRVTPILGGGQSSDHFKVIRGVLPDPRAIGPNEVVAISCERHEADGNLAARARGSAWANERRANMIKLPEHSYEWDGDWVVKWKSLEQAYGIVAQDLIHSPGASQVRRSPDAIQTAFFNFLRVMNRRNCRLAHVPLVAGVEGFWPWVSLIQMARAYGQWARTKYPVRPSGILRVNVYVVHPAVVTLLQGGYIDLLQELQDSLLHINVEVIQPLGQSDRYHYLVSSNEKLSVLAERMRISGLPYVYAYPAPMRQFEPMRLREALECKI